jgi:hypothetical protein
MQQELHSTDSNPRLQDGGACGSALCVQRVSYESKRVAVISLQDAHITCDPQNWQAHAGEASRESGRGASCWKCKGRDCASARRVIASPGRSASSRDWHMTCWMQSTVRCCAC